METPAVTNNRAYRLKTVTPRALKKLQELGLLGSDNQEFVNKTTEVYTDEVSLRQIIEVVFEDDFSDTDFNDIDLGVINRGLRDFLSAVFGR